MPCTQTQVASWNSQRLELQWMLCGTAHCLLHTCQTVLLLDVLVAQERSPMLLLLHAHLVSGHMLVGHAPVSYGPTSFSAAATD